MLRGIGASLVGRGVGAIGPVLLVPITLSYLGAETYGFWMAVTAVTAMVVWADLGLGNGLLTRLSRDFALDDAESARRNLASAYATLAPAALALLALLAVGSGIVPWRAIFNAQSADLAAPPEAVALVCIGAFLLNIPLSLVQRVQYATDRVAQSNLLQAAGILLSLVLTWLLARSDVGALPVIAGAVSGPLLGNLLNSLWFYGGSGRHIVPRWGDASLVTGRALLAVGSRFLVLSVITSAALNADNLVVTHALGLDAVADYAVATRIFASLGLLINLVNLPLWPANAAALARGEHDWVRNMTRRMTLLSAAAVAVPGGTLTALGPDTVMPLLGAGEGTSRALFLGLTVWWTLVAAASPRFMVQNSRAVLVPQTVGWLSYLVLSVPLKAIAAGSVGLAAVPVVGAVLYAGLVWTASEVGYRRALVCDGPVVRSGEA